MLLLNNRICVPSDSASIWPQQNQFRTVCGETRPPVMAATSEASYHSSASGAMALSSSLTAALIAGITAWIKEAKPSATTGSSVIWWHFAISRFNSGRILSNPPFAGVEAVFVNKKGNAVPGLLPQPPRRGMSEQHKAGVAFWGTGLHCFVHSRALRPRFAVLWEAVELTPTASGQIVAVDSTLFASVANTPTTRFDPQISPTPADGQGTWLSLRCSSTQCVFRPCVAEEGMVSGTRSLRNSAESPRLFSDRLKRSYRGQARKQLREPRTAQRLPSMYKRNEASPDRPATTDAALEQLLRRYGRNKTAITVNFRRLGERVGTPDRATHLIHSYPAKLLMHIPYFFLANSVLSERGDLVLDPFCGSGTVLLESLLAQRQALGVDSNPLACLISRVKTTPIATEKLAYAVASLLSRIPDEPKTLPPDVVNIGHWFYPHVVRQLQCIREAISRTKDLVVREFFLVSFSQCVRKVSLADPRLAVPVRLQHGQYPVTHRLSEKTNSHLRKLRRVNVRRVFSDILHTNAKRLEAIASNDQVLPSASVYRSDARRLRTELRDAIAPESVQLIVTSPPYPGAQKYIRSSSLSLGWLGLCASSRLVDLKRATIGREEYASTECNAPVVTGIPAADRRLQQIWAINSIRSTIAGVYLNEMREALQECYRVVKKGGYLVLVAANNQVCGRQFKTQEYLRQIAEEVGFTTVLRLVDVIRSRGLMTIRNRTAGVITREWVLVFNK